MTVPSISSHASFMLFFCLRSKAASWGGNITQLLPPLNFGPSDLERPHAKCLPPTICGNWLPNIHPILDGFGDPRQETNQGDLPSVWWGTQHLSAKDCHLRPFPLCLRCVCPSHMRADFQPDNVQKAGAIGCIHLLLDDLDKRRHGRGCPFPCRHQTFALKSSEALPESLFMPGNEHIHSKNSDVP